MHLELPLGRHDLSVDTGDLDAREEARLEVCLHDVARDGGAGARAAVVGALRPGEAALRPPQGPLGSGVQQRVLLLDVTGTQLK